MPYLQVINNVQHNDYALRNLLNYVARKDKCICGLYGVTNVLIPSYEENLPLALKNYNEALRRFHSKGDGRYALHYIFSFAPSESRYFDPQKVLDLGYFIASRAFQNQVCYFSVHNHSCYRNMPGQIYYHIDMMVLTVDIMNGVLYSLSKPGGYRILHDLMEYMKKYVPENDISKPIVFCGRTHRDNNEGYQEIELQY